MPQSLVADGVGGNSVAVAVDVLHRNRIRGTRNDCQIGIPNSEAANVMRSNIASLHDPVLPKLALQSQIPLLRVWRINVQGSAGERRQID